MSRKPRLLAAPAVVALFSMLASPALAAPVPSASAPQAAAWSADALAYQNHRHWRYRRDRGVDASDVIAGVLLIGGIAAVASAATRVDDQRDRYSPRDPYRGDEDRGWRDDDGATGGLANAARMCADEVEQQRAVDTVENVERRASGWTVTGTTESGDGFTCNIGNDGRIDRVTYQRGEGKRLRGDDRYDRAGRYARDRYYDGRYDDGRYDQDRRSDDERYDRDEEPRYDRDASPAEDRQWDAERYRLERERLDRQAGRPPAVEQQQSPAYPGGPLPGEDDEAPPADDGMV